MKRELLVIICLLCFATNVFSQVFTSGVINTKIPNNGSGITLSINVSGLPSVMNNSFGLESLCLDINHTSVNNLEAYLLAPNGIQVALTTQNGGNGDNYTGTCFSMNATQSVLNGIAPFTGSFRPQGDFGAVNNGSPNGNWKLVVVDIIPGGSDSGIVVNWSLNFSNTPAQALTLSSNLPLIIIKTNGKWIVDEPKATVNMEIFYKGPGNRNNLTDVPSFKGLIDIEIRGSTAQMFPKKSYGFETLNESGDKNLDTSLLGLPKEHAWVLHAPYSDKSLLRNVLTYKLYSEMGHYSPRTKLVELVVNGQYQGVYVLIEKIRRDKRRVNISKLSQTDVSGDNLTGGYIIKIDRRTGSKGYGWRSSYKSQGDTAIWFQYHYPSEDSIVSVQKNYIKSYVDSFETALYSNSFNITTGYRKFISITSVVDAFLINELSKNIDGYRLSTYIFKDKKSKGGKLQLGPLWDYDIAWYNANANGGNTTSDWQFKMLSDQYPVPFWWKKLNEDPIFWNDVQCRFNKLKSQVLNTSNINRIIDSLATLLGEAEVRNFNQWPILSKNVYNNPQPMPGNYSGEITNIKNFVKNRLIWMQSNIHGDINNCPVSSINDEGNEEITFSVFPNPFVKSFTVNYEVKKPININIEIYNVIGERVAFYAHSKLPGNYTQNIEMASLPAGVYFIRAKVGETIINQKVIKTQ